ncbi:LysM peptidoglycan-binding domain-containing protein [Mesobacillus foraminis]|uniref:LysM peptidoglycan-binding and 3D domain-containing protein n=1 Tax=Mesobacillus foraminis TaxID=279826 RepID=UPI001BE6DB59|nr:3D domain-containing protein [Mesobacillus foraminis]MBT2757064.1 LysM peptidoglycan-binding domain-containing protein [Mesobacillus foraminis]
MRKTLLSLIAAAAISGAAGVNAQAEEIVVHKGDTLWKLSKEYGVSVDSIKKWNNLSSDVIHPNDSLEISPVKHLLVSKGDSLWNIAKVYGVSVEDLMKWNKLSSDVIHPGLDLVIYTDRSDNNSVQAASANVQEENKVLGTDSQEQEKPAAKPQAETKPQAVAKPQAEAKPQASNPAPAADTASDSKEITVSATAYTADCKGCSGTTATGVDLKANPNQKVIAVDPSVIPLGTKVHVQGYGYATASDTGGAIKGNKIDVFIPNHNDAVEWGRKQVKVTIID